MGQVVELEGATEAVDAGSKVSLTAATSKTISNASGSRKVLHIFNYEASEDIFVTYGDTATADGIPIPAKTGLIIKQYQGAISLYSVNGATEVRKAEF